MMSIVICFRSIRYSVFAVLFMGFSSTSLQAQIVPQGSHKSEATTFTEYSGTNSKGETVEITHTEFHITGWAHATSAAADSIVFSKGDTYIASEPLLSAPYETYSSKLNQLCKNFLGQGASSSAPFWLRYGHQGAQVGVVGCENHYVFKSGVLITDEKFENILDTYK